MFFFNFYIHIQYLESSKCYMETLVMNKLCGLKKIYMTCLISTYDFLRHKIKVRLNEEFHFIKKNDGLYLCHSSLNLKMTKSINPNGLKVILTLHFFEFFFFLLVTLMKSTQSESLEFFFRVFFF